MNNTTITVYNSTYRPFPSRPMLSKQDLYKRFRSHTQASLDLSLIPICIVGVVLNAISLIVLRSNRFNLPFYTYLRAYVLASLMICLVNGTQFTIGNYTILEFTNSQISVRFYSYFFQPFLNITNIYGSMLDIILSMERVVLVSKKLQWFRKISPKLLCLILFVVSFMISVPYWFSLSPYILSTQLEGGIPFIINYVRPSRFFVKVRDYIKVLPYIVDIIPIILEVSFNVCSVYLYKNYAKKKVKIMNNGIMIREGTSKSGVPNKNEPTNQRTSNNGRLSNRAKKMEIKITILVIFLSVLSTM
jgi:hypothetical protein